MLFLGFSQICVILETQFPLKGRITRRMLNILFIYPLSTLIFDIKIIFSLNHYDYLCFLFSYSLIKHLKIDNPMRILFLFSLLNVFQGSSDKQISPIQSLFQPRKAQIFNKYVFYLSFYSQKLKFTLNTNTIYLFC